METKGLSLLNDIWKSHISEVVSELLFLVTFQHRWFDSQTHYYAVIDQQCEGEKIDTQSSSHSFIIFDSTICGTVLVYNPVRHI